MNLANFIYSISNNEGNCYNGHCQLSISKMSIDVALQVIRDLEFNDPENRSYTIELWSDESFGVYCRDFWDKDEREDGQTNKLIFSVAG